VVDSAVHNLHVLILTQAFVGVRGSEEWLNVFCSFPKLDGAKAFFREVIALRAILPADGCSDLDTEVGKVKAAYVLASKFLEGSRTTKVLKRKARTPKIEQSRISP
jgi:hypothetical protein